MTKIYLISPPQIELENFSKQLKLSLKTGLVPAFQLRLKGFQKQQITHFAKELKKICHDHNCLFLLNDSYKIALEIAADGVHLGAEDGSISLIRQESKNFSGNFLIGASCYDSKHLAMEAGEQGADYLSFGAFFESKTKVSRGKPSVEILSWCDELINLPSVAIGGITDKNCCSLVEANTDFLAVISYVWNNPFGVEVAIKNLNSAITAGKKKPA